MPGGSKDQPSISAEGRSAGRVSEWIRPSHGAVLGKGRDARYFPLLGPQRDGRMLAGGPPSRSPGALAMRRGGARTFREGPWLINDGSPTLHSGGPTQGLTIS